MTDAVDDGNMELPLIQRINDAPIQINDNIQINNILPIGNLTLNTVRDAIVSQSTQRSYVAYNSFFCCGFLISMLNV